MYIGIDDTDSVEGMCTTYLAAILTNSLKAEGLPRLIRLNPNIPYKTRGNGAVMLKTQDHKAEEKVVKVVDEYAMLSDEKTNPGVVILNRETIPDSLKEFYKKALTTHVKISHAKEVIESVGCTSHSWKNGRGMIGALASIGFHGRATYEHLSYRTSENYHKPRKISHESVSRMNDLLFPYVFDNIDSSGNPIILPKGKDPVFCGIRGMSQDYVTKAYSMLEAYEPIEASQVFLTNQATDAHYVPKKISDISQYDCVSIEGSVSNPPERIEGGHVVFNLGDGSGNVDCMVYEPSQDLRDVAMQLDLGDTVEIKGGIGKYSGSVNVEKLVVKGLAVTQKPVIPVCCGKKMSSAGSGKGVKCKKCGRRVSQDSLKVSQISRSLGLGVYEAPPGSRRHLSMPEAIRDLFHPM